MSTDYRTDGMIRFSCQENLDTIQIRLGRKAVEYVYCIVHISFWNSTFERIY